MMMQSTTMAGFADSAKKHAPSYCSQISQAIFTYTPRVLARLLFKLQDHFIRKDLFTD